MTTDAEIDAATEAMRKIRTVGGKIHDDVLRAYARAALEAAERVLIERVRKRTELRQNVSNGNPPPGDGSSRRAPTRASRTITIITARLSRSPHHIKGWGAGARASTVVLGAALSQQAGTQMNGYETLLVEATIDRECRSGDTRIRKIESAYSWKAVSSFPYKVNRPARSK